MQLLNGELLSTRPAVFAGGSDTGLHPELHSTCHEHVDPHPRQHRLHHVRHFGSGE